MEKKKKPVGRPKKGTPLYEHLGDEEQPVTLKNGWVRRPAGGKFRQLRKEVIPNLRMEIRHLKKEVEKWKEMNKYGEKELAALVRKGVAEEKKRMIAPKLKRSQKGKAATTRRVVKKVTRDSVKKIVRIFETRTAHLDGVLMTPIIVDWCKETKMHYTLFRMWVILRHHKWFTMDDCELFNFGNYRNSYAKLKKLLALGYMEKVTANGKNVYYNSDLGKKEYHKFQMYCAEKMKLITRQMVDMVDYDEVKIRVRPPGLVKKILDGNKQQDPERESGS